MFNRIDSNTPMTFTNFANLYKLRVKKDADSDIYIDKYVCPRIVENPHVSPLTDPITGEVKKDEETQEILYPTVIDHENWDIILWDNFAAGGTPLSTILEEYGEKIVLNVNFKENDDGIKIFTITVK